MQDRKLRLRWTEILLCLHGDIGGGIAACGQSQKLPLYMRKSLEFQLSIALSEHIMLHTTHIWELCVGGWRGEGKWTKLRSLLQLLHLGGGVVSENYLPEPPFVLKLLHHSVPWLSSVQTYNKDTPHIATACGRATRSLIGSLIHGCLQQPIWILIASVP